jgi:integrase
MPFRHQNSPHWHYDFQIGGRRFSGSCGTADYQEAKAVEAQARVAARAAPQTPPGIYTLSQALGTYSANVAQHQPSWRTTQSQAKALIAGLGAQTRLDQITDSMILAHVARRRATVANGTVNRELQLLGRAIRHIVDFHQATAAPLKLKAAEVAEPRERIRELSADEQTRLFAKLRPDLHPLALLALMTGARRAELCNLKWSDVDLQTSRLRFTIKGSAALSFPINPELRAMLTSLPRAETPQDRAYVLTYVDEQTGHRRRISPNGGGIHGDFHNAVIEAEILDFRFHDLRHTFATRMLRQTGNLKLVSRLLGHTTVETTARYAHVLDADLAEAMAGFRVAPRPQSRRKSRTDG